MPPSLQDWLPENHLARFLARIVDALDLSKILARYVRNDGRGKAAWHPVMMVRLLRYGYAVGVRSSRRIEKATYEDVAFRYLAADQHPDHDTIAEFRKVHLEELSGLFWQALRLCEKAGLVKMGQVAIDGTKVAANASKQASRSTSWLSQHEQELAAKGKALLEEAEALDQKEDERFGKGKRGDELPEELRTTPGQLKSIAPAKQELEREAREKAEPAAREKAAQKGKPKDEAQKKRWQRARPEPAAEDKGNCTDPESRLMKDGASQAFVQAYNAQIAVAGVPQIIVAQAVVQETNDKQQLTPMVEQVVKNVGAAPELTLADAGYWDESSVVGQQAQGRDVLVPPDGPKTSRSGELPKNAPMGPAAPAMRQRLKDEPERKRYRKRNGIVEPVFGWIKNALGYRRFLLRGLAKVRGEWALICTVINLSKLFRYGKPCENWLVETAMPA